MGNYNLPMMIHIRSIANEPLLNAMISNVEDYCNGHDGFKIVTSSCSVYWKNINIRECNLCLNINMKYSQEYFTDVITAIFKLQIENAVVIENDETCEIDYYAQLDDLIYFSDKFALFAYVNKSE